MKFNKSKIELNPFRQWRYVTGYTVKSIHLLPNFQLTAAKVYRLENGQHFPNDKDAAILADMMGVGAHQLMKEWVDWWYTQ